MAIDKPLTQYRGTLATGLSESGKVSRDGGMFDAGLIEGFSVITRGEAMGHNMWVDQSFVVDVAAALSSSRRGSFSRFTHPDMSADGLSKGLGRVTFSNSENSDIARGSLHFYKSAHSTPDGNLADYVMQRAMEDPSSFGASISFIRDIEAEDADFVAMGGKIFVGEDGFKEYDFSSFRSTDPLNTKSFMHTRLLELRAVDIVGEPAANDGLFCGDSVFAEAGELFDYAIGIKDKAPQLTAFDVDPERLMSFITKRLASKGLSIVKIEETKIDEIKDEKPEAAVEDAPVAEVPVAEVKTEPDAESEDSTVADVDAVEPAIDVVVSDAQPVMASGREELSNFMATFGEAQGARWFAEGKDFAAAQSEFISILKKENESLREKLQLADESEAVALSTGGVDEPQNAKRKGYASNIRIAAKRK